MNYRAFGRTDLRVSELGMGCSGIGGGLHGGDDREAVATLRRAFEAGVTFFDTSDSYSLGRSEQLIGRAFRGRRSQVIVATKGGFVYSRLGWAAVRLRPLARPVRALLRPARVSLNRLKYSQKSIDFSPGYLAQAVHRSLRRLRSGYIDLYQLHNPPPDVLREGRCYEALERLKRQGKIRYYGVSCAAVEDAAAALEHPGNSAVQVRCNLLDQEALDGPLTHAQQHGVAVIVREPLAQGLLSGGRHDTKAAQVVRDLEQLRARQARAAAFAFLAVPGRTLAQAALQFVLQTPGVSIVIPGISRRPHLDEALAAAAAPPLSATELARIRALRG